MPEWLILELLDIKSQGRKEMRSVLLYINNINISRMSLWGVYLNQASLYYNFHYQWPKPYHLYKFQPLLFSPTLGRWAPPFNGTWKPNAAALTRQTFISIISDPNHTICIIFSHYSYHLPYESEPSPSITPGSQTQQLWHGRRLFLLSVTQTIPFV